MGKVFLKKVYIYSKEQTPSHVAVFRPMNKYVSRKSDPVNEIGG